MKIYALGPRGTYGHEAALVALRSIPINPNDTEVEVTFCERNEQVLESVAIEHCFGIVPIENSSAGLVSEVVKYWMHPTQRYTAPYVIGEVVLPIEHMLLVHEKRMESGVIDGVLSHPQALAQCATALDELGLKNRLPWSSTAGAAEAVSTNPQFHSMGAIASRFAGELYGLEVLKRNLADSSQNATRFHLVASHGVPEQAYRDHKTALIVWLPDEPGSLLDLLWCVSAKRKVNMSSIHSIPTGAMGEYAFYLEFDAHLENAVGKEIIGKIRAMATRLAVLGSYPQYEFEQ